MIKRGLLTLAMVLCVLSGMAQFNTGNSLVRKTILAYELGNDGYYHKKAGTLVDVVDNVESTYAFEKKSSSLYVLTKNGNYMIVLTKDYAKVYKQSNLAPTIDEKLIDIEIQRNNNALTERFESLNTARRKHLKDSTDRARHDSIMRVRQDSLNLALKKATEENYRLTHDWRQLPVNRMGLECLDCHKQFYDKSVRCEGIVNDTIFFSEKIDGVMGCSYEKMHASATNPKLKADAQFKSHCQIFGDSLKNKPYLSLGYLKAENQSRYATYVEAVSVKAPNGYVDSWGYDFQEDLLMFDFAYTNTNKKAIKVIEIYYNIRDAAGTVKKTGKLRTDSPLEPFETKPWSWNDTTVAIPNGATDIDIAKVVITYKDGKIKTLVKELIYKEEK